jgi:hypothetical protein
MPRGYLKHKKNIGRKKARGGASHSSSSGKKNGSAGRNKRAANKNSGGASAVTDFPVVAKQDQLACFAEDSCAKPKKQPAKYYSVAECCICMEQRQVLVLSKKCSWHDAACYDCLRRCYVTDAQKDVSNFPLCCFHPQCRKPVHYAQLVKHNLFHSRDERKRHYELEVLCRRDKKTHLCTVYCPRCSHPRFVKRPSKEECKECKNCQERFLVSPDFATILAIERFQTDGFGENHGWARCPHCSVLICKGDGGSDMWCVYCDRPFDWDDAIQTQRPLARPHADEIYKWW